MSVIDTLSIVTKDLIRATNVNNLNHNQMVSNIAENQIGFFRLHGYMLQFCYERTLDKTIPI